MILVEANLLLYAYDSGSPHHKPARRWIEDVFFQTEPVRLAWATIFAFLRISTSARMRDQPLLMPQAVSIVSEWLAQPNVGILEAGERHWEILGDLLLKSQTRGPLVLGGYIAAHPEVWNEDTGGE